MGRLTTLKEYKTTPWIAATLATLVNSLCLPKALDDLPYKYQPSLNLPEASQFEIRSHGDEIKVEMIIRHYKLLINLFSPPNPYPFIEKYDPKNSVLNRFSPPFGFERQKYRLGSFPDWIQNLPLKPEKTPAYYYEGSVAAKADDIGGVVDIDTPNWVQQCADVAMRLWAEYLYQQNEDITFTLQIGKTISWNHWKKGNRPYFDEKKRLKYNYKSNLAISENKREDFYEFLDFVMMYTGSYALHQHLIEIKDEKDLQPGDLIIHPNHKKPGGFGHLYTILDKSQNQLLDYRYVIAEGFTPATDLVILKTTDNRIWLTIDDLHYRFGNEKSIKDDPDVIDSSPDNTYFHRF